MSNYSKFTEILPEGEDAKTYLRPKSIDEMFDTDGSIKTIKNLIDKDMLPHFLIFYGPPGTGKTTLSQVIPYEVAKKRSAKRSIVHNINGALMLKDYTKDLGKTIEDTADKRTLMSAFTSNPTFFIINEAHKMTTDSQQVLKDYFEKSMDSKNVYVIFNLDEDYRSCIHQALISRARGGIFRLPSLNKDNGILFVRSLIGDETESGIDDDFIVKYILEPSNFQHRDVIGTLQYLASGGEPRNVDEINPQVKYNVRLFVTTCSRILAFIMDGKKAEDIRNSTDLNRARLFSDVYNTLFQNVRGLDYIELIDSISKYSRNLLINNTGKDLFLFYLYSTIYQEFSRKLDNSPYDFLVRATTRIIDRFLYIKDVHETPKRIASELKVLMEGRDSNVN